MPTQPDPRSDAFLAKAAPFAQPILHFGCTLAAGARSASVAARARRPHRRVEEPSSRQRDVGKISVGPPPWVDQGDHRGEAPQDAWQTSRHHAGVARRGQDAELEMRRLLSRAARLPDAKKPGRNRARWCAHGAGNVPRGAFISSACRRPNTRCSPKRGATSRQRLPSSRSS